ncbi:hypothetical protein [Nannocystis sp.]|uniref:hypothetical protein n=1 Tax=Nannocystis sp. TaxID=1962667 RepID=UPI0025D44402|nr:hypothetical protein [Nannocystis sp.]MBK7823924.1 hypothetical protein [Nannocystis sp.]
MPADAPVDAAPVDVTDAPADATVDLTDAPADAPADLTDAPADATDATVDVTDAPADAPADAPVDLTDAPADAPVDLTDAPADAPAATPVDVTDAPPIEAAASTLATDVLARTRDVLLATYRDLLTQIRTLAGDARRYDELAKLAEAAGRLVHGAFVKALVFGDR